MISWTRNGFLHLSHITNPAVCEARYYTQYSDRLRLDSRGIMVQHLTDPKHSLSSKSFRLTVASTQPATRRTSMALHPGHEPTTDLCLESRLRDSGSTPPLPHTFIAWTWKTVPYPVGGPMSFPYIFGQRVRTIQSVMRKRAVLDVLSFG
jgi:hypothetical protein